MRYDPPLEKAILIKRYKRFLADVLHPELGEITVHCPNTGSMKNCWKAGWNVWLQRSNNTKRKYPYTWVLAQDDQNNMIGINTVVANKIAVEGIKSGKIKQLDEIKTIQQEVKYGEENSRIDILIEHLDDSKTYIEVKSVTLKNGTNQQDYYNPNFGSNVGFFPDAITTRGQKHIRELINCVKQGDRAILLFLVQHTGIERVTIATDIDPDYTALLKLALDVGVEVLVYSAEISDKSIVLDRQIGFSLEEK